MYQVIGFPKTRVMRVLWMLEELGEAYELTPALPHSDEARAANPTGKVPTLIVDGRALLDSVAIIQFLADRHGALTFPAGTIERARQDALTQFCVDEIEGALWTFSKNEFIHPEDIRVKAIAPVCEMEFHRAQEQLEARLGDSEFVMGDTFTVPDLLLGHCAAWAQNMPKWPWRAGKVTEYFTRVRARPALARAMARGAEATAKAG